MRLDLLWLWGETSPRRDATDWEPSLVRTGVGSDWGTYSRGAAALLGGRVPLDLGPPLRQISARG